MGDTMTQRYLTAAALERLSERLAPRDWRILEHVAQLRFLTGGQLTRLCFADDAEPSSRARTARRALLRLVRLDVLARLPRAVGGVRAGSAGFVYHLGPAGQRLAADRGWQPERRWRRSFTPGTLFVAHTLQVAELHTRLVEADRSGRVELLELSAEPSCWRAFVGGGSQRSVLKPDSFLCLATREYEYSYFLEVDRGTEGSRALERQLALYMAYRATGQEQAAAGVFPKVLWLAPSAERAAAIEASVAAVPAHGRELFAVAPFERALDVIGVGQDC
jgi:hypothetical protein